MAITAEVLWKSNDDKAVEYRRLLKVNREHARAYLYHNNNCSFNEIVKITNSDTNSVIIKQMQVSEGMSITNKRFKYASCINQAIISKKGLYVRNGKLGIRTMNIGDVINMGEYGKHVYKAVIAIYPKLGFIENANRHIQQVTLNTILKHKLYGISKLNNYVTSCNNRKASELIVNNANAHILKLIKKYCINLENANEELLKNHLFNDTLLFAQSLNKRINLAWSVTRLAQEHDNWSRTIVKYTTEDRPLKFNEAQLELISWLANNLPEMKVIDSTLELVMEGKKQNHCVGTYTGLIETFGSTVFHWNGYTADISKDYVLNQLKGFNNVNAPQEMQDKLKSLLNEYKKELSNVGSKYIKVTAIHSSSNIEIEPQIRFINDQIPW